MGVNSKPEIARGKQIYLRPVIRSDVTQRYVDWLNDPEANRYLESRFATHNLKSVQATVEEWLNDGSLLFLAIVTVEDDLHIGNVKLGPIDRIHSIAPVGIMIGDRQYWGRGVASEALELVAGYAFSQLGLHKLSAGIYTNNVASIRAFEKAGFALEATLTDHRRFDDTWIDEVRMSLINPVIGSSEQSPGERK